MKMSTRGKYALIVMIYLAKNYESKRYISLKEISESENISYKYLERIMMMLNKYNFLEVQRGNNGGYRLNRKPSEYKIGDILRSSEGDLSVSKCLNDECKKKCKCSIYPFLDDLYYVINNFVDGKKLSDYIGGE